jgi:hypothetical protein
MSLISLHRPHDCANSLKILDNWCHKTTVTNKGNYLAIHNNHEVNKDNGVYNRLYDFANFHIFVSLSIKSSVSIIIYQ